MDEESKPANWVERRARQEHALRIEAPSIWNEVRAAIQDACDTFNEKYPHPTEYAVKCKLENGHRMLVTRLIVADGLKIFQPYHAQAIIGYSAKDFEITVAYDSRASQVFRIEADGEDVFVAQGTKRITPDGLSKIALEDMFFPVAHDRA